MGIQGLGSGFFKSPCLPYLSGTLPFPRVRLTCTFVAALNCLALVLATGYAFFRPLTRSLCMPLANKSFIFILILHIENGIFFPATWPTEIASACSFAVVPAQEEISDFDFSATCGALQGAGITSQSRSRSSCSYPSTDGYSKSSPLEMSLVYEDAQRAYAALRLVWRSLAELLRCGFRAWRQSPIYAQDIPRTACCNTLDSSAAARFLRPMEPRTRTSEISEPTTQESQASWTRSSPSARLPVSA